MDKLLEYKRSWIQHVNRMPRNRLPRVMKHYSPTGRRNRGRPLKRRLDTWDRNGSTSGPTLWHIYDDEVWRAESYLKLICCGRISNTTIKQKYVQSVKHVCCVWRIAVWCFVLLPEKQLEWISLRLMLSLFLEPYSPFAGLQLPFTPLFSASLYFFLMLLAFSTRRMEAAHRWYLPALAHCLKCLKNAIFNCIESLYSVRIVPTLLLSAP